MEKIHFLLLLCFLIHCSGGGMNNLAGDDLYQSIPDKILDWKSSDEDAVYDRETLFDYMNGGAELYLAYDFKRIFVRRFAGPGKNEIVLDIYDMGSSEEAFGIFSLDREDEEADIGQGSTYGFGLLRFWKDRYFISINALGDEQAAEPAILELGKAVAALIKQEGTLPALLSFLPGKNLKKEKTSYFHSNISLNNRFFIASENILGLSNRTRCVFAEYVVDSENTAYLLLIQYGDNAHAQGAFESFIGSYMSEAKDSGFARMENGKWTMAKVEKNRVSIVFDAPDKEWAHGLQSEIKFN